MRSNGPLRLTQSARDSLAYVIRHGEATRPELCADLGLSRPTASAAMAELSGWDLVEETEVRPGSTGRSAAVYALSPRSGYVLGIDAGSTAVRVVAAGIDGRYLTERMARRKKPGRVNAWTELATVRSMVADVQSELGSERGTLHAIRLAVPTTVRPDGSTTESTREWQRFVDHLAETPGTVDGTVRITNNVNCSAWAEHVVGAARGRESSVFLQVGVNIGLGIVHGGRLLSGSNGAAGEIAFMPYPWRPGSNYELEALEHRIGADSWIARVGSSWREGPPPGTARELLDAAARGEQAARRAVREHAREIGRFAAAIVTVLDPGFVVLGGGVGQHPLIVTEVSDYLAQLPWPTRVVPSELGDTATAQGAARLAATEAVEALLQAGRGATAAMR